MRFLVFKKRNIIIVILTLSLLFTVLYFYRDYLQRRFFGINQGVVFLDNEMEFCYPQEVFEIVKGYEEKLYISPVDALVDNERNSIIPELNGYHLYTEKIVEKILSAPKGKNIVPIYKVIRPEISMADYPELPLYQGNSQKTQVSLMVNVAWGEEHLPQILEIMNKEAIKSTFFVTGKWAEKNREMVEKIIKNGHQVASHGYSDSITLTEVSYKEAEKDILKSKDIIEDISGETLEIFSTHKGVYNESILSIAAENDLRLIMWSLDTVDWMKPSVEDMYNKIYNNIHNGALVLMHPTENSVEFLKAIIPDLKTAGYELVTVSEALSPSIFHKWAVSPAEIVE